MYIASPIVTVTSETLGLYTVRPDEADPPAANTFTNAGRWTPPKEPGVRKGGST